jgi:hypothetical protein
MNTGLGSVALVACIFLTTVRNAVAGVELSRAIEIAMTRWPNEATESVTMTGGKGRHGFYIRPIKVTPTADGVTAEGFFRHRHRGKDDRVYYSIVVQKGQPYKAVLTKIEYRGILDNEVVEVALEAGGATSNPGVKTAIAKAFVELLRKANIQRRLDGDWESQAVLIVDAIGARVAKELK